MKKPALTPEEWAELRVDWYSANRGPYVGWPVADGARRLEIDKDNVEVHLDPEEYTAIPQWGLHAVAALCLHGQPFGFTWEDVANVRKAATEACTHDEGARYYDEAGSPRLVLDCDEEAVHPLTLLADRIEALLPPEPS